MRRNHDYFDDPLLRRSRDVVSQHWDYSVWWIDWKHQHEALVSKITIWNVYFDLAPYTQAPVIEGYQSVFEDELTLAVEVERNQGVNHLFEQLSQQGIKVLSMRNKSNRLEELFLKITEDTYQREDQHV